MKMKELKEKPRAELEKLLEEKREAFNNFRFNLGFGKTKNLKLGSVLKKDIARILTLLNSK